MKILPKSGSEWFVLLSFPFKVFVPAGYLALATQRYIGGSRHDDSVLLVPVVLFGYMVSFCVLVLVAVIQRNIGPRGAYLSTCGFIVALFIFGWLTLPYLAR